MGNLRSVHGRNIFGIGANLVASINDVGGYFSATILGPTSSLDSVDLGVSKIGKEKSGVSILHSESLFK